MTKRIRYVSLAILFLLTASVVVDTAVAQESRPLRGRQGVWGEIVARDELTLTVAGDEGEVMIIADGETRIYIVGKADATINDLEVGATIVARGARQDDGSVVARLIVRQPDGDVAVGRVATLSNDGLVMDHPDGREIMIIVDPATIVTFRGEELTWAGEPSGRDAIREGMRLAAFGTASEDGLTLEVHTLVSARPRPRPRRLAGRIDAVERQTIVMSTAQRAEVTVVTTDHTRFRMPGGDEPGLQDLSPGQPIVVIGRPSGEAEITATQVILIPERRPARRPVLGQIEAINGTEITLTTLSGETIILSTDSTTRFRIGADNNASLGEFASGDRVAIFGRHDSGDSTIHATHVLKRE